MSSLPRRVGPRSWGPANSAAVRLTPFGLLALAQCFGPSPSIFALCMIARMGGNNDPPRSRLNLIQTLVIVGIVYAGMAFSAGWFPFPSRAPMRPVLVLEWEYRSRPTGAVPKWPADVREWPGGVSSLTTGGSLPMSQRGSGPRTAVDERVAYHRGWVHALIKLTAAGEPCPQLRYLPVDGGEKLSASGTADETGTHRASMRIDETTHVVVVRVRETWR